MLAPPSNNMRSTLCMHLQDSKWDRVEDGIEVCQLLDVAGQVGMHGLQPLVPAVDLRLEPLEGDGRVALQHL
eukprot:scaffold222417_cov42-Prasinocladus_malaysianus.AAC.1